MAQCGFFGLFLFVPLLFAISGCTYPISRELRHQAQKGLTFSEVLQNPSAHVGSIVIWGGVILETQNYPNGTEILALETPLEYRGKPVGARFSQGRFIAKTSKFLDPAVYVGGGRVTVAGEIIGKETRPLGQAQYAYPVVQAKEIYLWKHHRYSYEYYWWDWYGPYF